MQHALKDGTLILTWTGGASLWRDANGKPVAISSKGYTDYLLPLPDMKQVLWDRPEAFPERFRRAVARRLLAL